jgi:hypothetical protein
MADSWNSVQVVTLIVDAATPVTVAVLGVIFARASRKIEQVQWANQTVVTRRLDVFDKLAPGLNRRTRCCSPTRCSRPITTS